MPASVEIAEPRTLRLHREDNIAVAIDPLPAGVQAEGLTARDPIPRGHKLAVSQIAEGAPVRKFGQIIGFATRAIAAGEHVHEHNCAMRDFDRDYRFAEAAEPEDLLPEAERASFQGFRRDSGRVGTRNYLGILTSVNCSASVARFIAQAVEREGPAGRLPQRRRRGRLRPRHRLRHGHDRRGLRPLPPGSVGLCRSSQPGRHVLLVGLGCEVFQIPRFMEAYGLEESESFRTMTIQGQGGTRRTIEQGLAIAKRDAAAGQRGPSASTCPASELTLALQCGGSDGYSGITANPALGAAARPAGAQRRHRHPVGDAGDLRRRAPADPPRREPRRSAQG